LLAAGAGRSYLAAALAAVAASCGRPPAALAPEGAFAPVSAAAFQVVAARTLPAAAQFVAIRWRYEDEDRAVSGRGAVRVAPPDSLRLDVAASILFRATLVLAGDSAWAEPETVAREVLPGRSIVWAMLGVVRPPESGTFIEVEEVAGRRLYRFTSRDGVTTTLEVKGDTLRGATQARGERPIGRLVLTRDAGGALVKAEATDLEHGTRFAVDVDKREASGPFPSEIWRRP
jgi:hypothetical protein